MQHTIIEVLPMKMEFIFLGVTILALGGLILTWVGPSGAAVTDLVSVCEETDNGNNVRMRGYVQHNGWVGEDHCTQDRVPVQGCRGRECRIAEYLCRGGEPAMVEMPCPRFAFVCHNGECVEPGEIGEPWQRTIAKV